MVSLADVTVLAKANDETNRKRSDSMVLREKIQALSSGELAGESAEEAEADLKKLEAQRRIADLKLFAKSIVVHKKLLDIGNQDNVGAVHGKHVAMQHQQTGSRMVGGKKPTDIDSYNGVESIDYVIPDTVDMANMYRNMGAEKERSSAAVDVAAVCICGSINCPLHHFHTVLVQLDRGSSKETYRRSSLLK